MVRSPEKGKLLESFGIKPVIGNLNDAELLESLAEKAHIVFSTVCHGTALYRQCVLMPGSFAGGFRQLPSSPDDLAWHEEETRLYRRCAHSHSHCKTDFSFATAPYADNVLASPEQVHTMTLLYCALRTNSHFKFFRRLV